jgi:hypothetical protein
MGSQVGSRRDLEKFWVVFASLTHEECGGPDEPLTNTRESRLKIVCDIAIDL